MPRNKDLKRVIRARMKKTGESYTAARAHLLSRRAKTTSAAKPSPAGSVDHAALAGMSDEVIAARTGRTWREWTQALDAANASSMSHRDIAVLVHQQYGLGSWWAQSVTLGYERIKGLRERGQRRSGEYEVNKSRTVAVSVQTLFDAWAEDRVRRRWLDGVQATIRTATRPKSIRLQWPDGTIVVAGFMAKGGRKSAVAVTHTKLRTRAEADEKKAFWSGRLDALASLLVRRLAAAG